MTKKKSKYNELLYIQNGKIVYISDKANTQEKEWLEKLGINAISKVFKIQFEAGGETEIESQNINAGQKAVKPENPVKSGNEFLYWYYEKNVGTESNPDYKEEIFNFENEIRQDYILFAKYTGEAVLTTYKENDYFWRYKEEITSISFEKGDMIIPENALYRWNIEKDSNCYPIIAYIIDNGINDSFRLVVKCDKDIYADTSLRSYFKDFRNAKNIELNNLDTSRTVEMSHMFYCTNNETTYALEKIVLGEKFNTKNVKQITAIFRGCGNLKDVDLTRFDTSNVQSMTEMFCRCYNLETIDVSHFNTSNTKRMDFMFYACKNVKSIDVSNFDTGNVTNMSNMFNECNKLTTLDLSKFDVSNVTNMEYMFGSCYKLTDVNINIFNANNAEKLDCMFYACRSLTELNLSNFTTNDVTDMHSMFYFCENLTSLDLTKFNTSKVTNMNSLFLYCYTLESIDISSFDTSSVTDMSQMFSECTYLTTIYVSDKFVTTDVKDSTNMFNRVKNIKGGNGTIFDSSVIDKTYACIDKEENAGYFTEKK